MSTSDRTKTPLSDPHDIFVPRAEVEASALHRLQRGTSRVDPRWALLGGVILLEGALFALVIALPVGLQALPIIAMAAVPLAGEWWLLLNQRALIREWRASGVLHSLWLAGEPEETTIAAAVGGPMAWKARAGMRLFWFAPVLLAWIYLAPIPIPRPLDGAFELGLVFWLYLLPAAAAIKAPLRDHVHVTSLLLRQHLAPSWDVTLLLHGMVSAIYLAAILGFSLGSFLALATVMHGVMVVALLGIFFWGVARSRVRAALWRDGLPLDARWRQFIGVDR